MRLVVVERPVRDVSGLMSAMKRVSPPFSVISVGADPKRTYVYLADNEGRDPSGHVRAWENRPELKVVLKGKREVVADGRAVIRIVVSYVDPFTGIPATEKMHVKVTSRRGSKVSPDTLSMKARCGMVEVGPSATLMDDLIEFRDSLNRTYPVTVCVRFVAGLAPIKPKPQLEPQPKRQLKLKKVEIGDISKGSLEGVWKVFRRLLKI